MGKRYKSNPDIPKEIRSDRRQRADWLKARGLCVNCTFEKVEDNFFTCRACRNLKRDKRLKRDMYLKSKARENKNLLADVDEATKLGMSYGQYIALKEKKKQQEVL